jgi:hypothetical protein
MGKPKKSGLKERARRLLAWVRHRVPPGVRTLLGIALIIGGIFGFLPVLGFWMIPLGVAVIALDFPGLRRWWSSRGRKR